MLDHEQDFLVEAGNLLVEVEYPTQFEEQIHPETEYDWIKSRYEDMVSSQRRGAELPWATLSLEENPQLLYEASGVHLFLSETMMVGSHDLRSTWK